MTFPSYPAYKDSGDEWLGKVPQHWQALALSRVLAAPVTDGPHTTPEFLDDGVPFLSVDGIQDGKLYFEGCRYVSFEDHKEFSKKAAPKYNDLLMGKAASIGKVARVTENIEFSIWSPLALIRVNESQCSPEFLEFCLKSSELQYQVLLASNSNTQLNIGMKDIPKLRIPLPDVKEQAQIARFLDHETARIDALIEEQQRLIELLKEKRQAVISHAVTKGLDPTVPMKDSGVEWLGEVPAHWNILSFNLLVYIAEGQVNPKLQPYLAMTLIAPNHVESSTGRLLYLETSEEQGADSGKYLCQEGDVVYSKIRPALRKVCVAPTACLCSADMYPMRGHSGLENQYLYWFILSEPFSAFALLESDRVAMPKINRESLGGLRLVRPPVTEQKNISVFLSIETQRVDALINEALSGVELLNERRAALISAAVTGKIDVRGWQPPANAAPQELESEAM